jgi:hypothetical protein
VSSIELYLAVAVNWSDLPAIVGYSFNSLAGQSDLTKVQKKMMCARSSISVSSFTQSIFPTSDSVANPTKSAQLFDVAVPYIPDFVFRLTCRLPLPGLLMMQKYKKETDELSGQLVQRKRDEGSKCDETLISRLSQFLNASKIN